MSTTANSSSTSSSNSTNTVLGAFGSPGIHPSLVLVIGIKFGLAIGALISSLSLVILTLGTRELQRPCNLLIAANALAIALTMINPMVTFAVVLSGTNLIPLGLCIYFQLLPIFATIFQYIIFISIGVERLLAVSFPFWYKAQSRKWQLSLAIGFAGAYSLYVCYDYFVYSTQNYNRMVMCSTPDTIDPSLLLYGICINAFSTALYALLWIILFLKRKSMDGVANKRILASVSVSFVLELFGWTANNVMHFMLSQFQLGELQKWFISNVAGYFLIVVIGLYAPIFYFCSKDYRRLFKEFYGKKMCANYNEGGPGGRWTSGMH